MRQVPTGWWYEDTRRAIDAAIASVSSSGIDGPGASSAPSMRPLSGAVRLMARAMSVASIMRRMSSG